MKTIKNISLIFAGLFIFSSCAQSIKISASKIVAEKNYVFVATSAIPLNSTDISKVLGKMNGNTGGGSINLTGSGYDLKITTDSVIAYLPYYGRAYTAPIGSDDNGIKFTSTKFNYEATKVKKGWQISIEVKDTKENQRLNLSIGENGYSTLNVSSNSRQTITFNGYIEERKQSK